MSVEEHVCSWGNWTRWIFYGSGLDIRERFCRGEDCNKNDYETRKHQHSYQAGVPDPFAPIGSGMTLHICSACHDVRN